MDLAGDYDRWFDDHADIYQAQLRLLGKAVPASGIGLEVGCRIGAFCRTAGYLLRHRSLISPLKNGKEPRHRGCTG